MNCPHCHYRIDPDFIYDHWNKHGQPDYNEYLCPHCGKSIGVFVSWTPKFKLEA